MASKTSLKDVIRSVTEANNEMVSFYKTVVSITTKPTKDEDDIKWLLETANTVYNVLYKANKKLKEIKNGKRN